MAKSGDERYALGLHLRELVCECSIMCVVTKRRNFAIVYASGKSLQDVISLVKYFNCTLLINDDEQMKR